ETSVGRQASNQPNEDFLFIRFMDITLPITRTLFFQQLVFENANSVLEDMHGPLHGEVMLTPARRHRDDQSKRNVASPPNENELRSSFLCLRPVPRLFVG